jgi:hypothetical protein
MPSADKLVKPTHKTMLNTNCGISENENPSLKTAFDVLTAD